MNPSASGLERAENCPASCVLPAHSYGSNDAARGTSIHAFVDRLRAGMPRAQALAHVSDEWRATCAGIDPAELWGDLSNVRCEVAYAYNVVTGEAKEIGVAIGRNYPALGEDWIVGTLDIEGERLDGVPVVRDIKTGWLDIAPPAENLQLGFFARVLATLRGAKEVEVAILRVREDGRVRPRPAPSYTFTTLELDVIDARLAEIVQRVKEARTAFEKDGRVRVSEGEHCRYCACIASCPAKTALARAMLPDLETIAGKVATMTVEEASRAWEMYKRIKPVFETVEDSLKARAKVEPLTLSSGKVVKCIASTRSSFDRGKALEMLRARGATDDEIASLTTEAPVEQVREVNGPNAEKKPRTKKTKEAA